MSASVAELKAMLVVVLSELINPDDCECYWSAGMLEELCTQCRIEQEIRRLLSPGAARPPVEVKP